jgi:hypothetical protein
LLPWNLTNIVLYLIYLFLILYLHNYSVDLILNKWYLGFYASSREHILFPFKFIPATRHIVDLGIFHTYCFIYL